MQPLTPVSPFSDLRTKPKQVLAKLKESPVVLTLRGRPTAVLVDYEAYNTMVQREVMREEIHTTQHKPLAEAAALLLEAYTADDELTVFTALDGEDVYVAG